MLRAYINNNKTKTSIAKVDQAMFCWGNVADGQLGLGGIEEEQIFTPRELIAFRSRHVADLSCGVAHTLFVMKDGVVYSCGNNDYGQLGHEKTRRKPEQIDALQAQVIHQVACGHRHSIALNDQGQVYSWGDNSHGQLGWQTTDTTFSRAPKLVKELKAIQVIQVACGYYHTLVLTNDSLLYSWGSNDQGQLGHTSDSSEVNQPKCIQSLIGLPIAQIATGGYHNFCLTISRALFGWGCNRYGQLGTGDFTNGGRQKPQPCNILRAQKAKFITCGENHTAVLTEDGGVFTWGAGMYGQLGHNSFNHESNPRKVFELMGCEVSMLACGRNHTMAYVQSSRKLYTFGLGGNGQLGIGQKENRLIPSVVSFDKNSPGQSDDHFVHFIASGGDQCFVSAVSFLSGVQPREFRFGGFAESNLCTITNDKIDLLSSIPYNEKPSADLSRYIENLFGSLGSMNGSFLKNCEQHFNCSPKNHGISLKSAHEKFANIRNLSNKYIKDSIEYSIVRLVSGLPKPPPDCEALRLYITIPCSSFFELPFNQSLVCSLGKALVLLDKSSMEVIESWWSRLGSDYLLRMIQVYKQTLMNILKAEGLLDGLAGITRRQNIYVCLEVLNRLKMVNDGHGQVVSYESFYIPDLHEKIDLKLDYLAWLQQTARMNPVIDMSNPAAIPLPVKLQGGLTTYCTYPFIFDGQFKTLLLKVDARIQMGFAMGGAIISRLFDANPEMPVLLLIVTRNNIVQDTIAQLSKYNDLDFKKPLQVIFSNEEALDAGGVTKEFFLLLLRDLLDPKYGMFEYFEESRLLWFCSKTFESAENYQLIGVVCGLAIYNGTIIDLSLPCALFKKVLKRPIVLDDLKQLMPTVGRNMQTILDYEGEDMKSVFGLTFEVSHAEFGEVVTRELEPGGSEKYVTKENRHDYVKKYIEYTFTTSVLEQFDAFNHGFQKVCGSWVLELFQPQELQAMVVGNENYDWEELKENTEYKGEYSKSHPTIKFFWEVFHEFSLEDKKKFLLFLTGSDRIPILGMKALKLVIQPMKVGSDFLPVAHTCFNILDLPPYQDKEILRKKLLRAIENTQGFGLA